MKPFVTREWRLNDMDNLAQRQTGLGPEAHVRVEIPPRLTLVAEPQTRLFWV